MKIKCNDGTVREFSISDLANDIEAFCSECGDYFGFHDTKILKQRFREHTCELETESK